MPEKGPTATTTATSRDRSAEPVVIAHDFAETYGGAERVLAVIAEAFPEAPVYAIAGRPSVAERMGVADRFHTLLRPRPGLLRNYRWLAPAYPALVRRSPLPPARVLVTSSYAFAHGFRTANGAPQLCYCHSPLRFAWRMTSDYAGELWGGAFAAAGLRALAWALRAADRRAAAGVRRYVANSRFVADEIRRHYGRQADVLHPPVDLELFRPAPSGGHDGYYLLCGRLVEPYKRARLAVEAFRGLPEKRLVVAGDGPALPELRALASPNVEFVGALEDEALVQAMQRCAALVFPSSDDFGMVPVEAMACGRPVIALREGGAQETVVPGRTGEFFTRAEPQALRDAVANFDPSRYEPAAIREHAGAWDHARFVERLRELVANTAGG